MRPTDAASDAARRRTLCVSTPPSAVLAMLQTVRVIERRIGACFGVGVQSSAVCSLVCSAAAAFDTPVDHRSDSKRKWSTGHQRTVRRSEHLTCHRLEEISGTRGAAFADDHARTKRCSGSRPRATSSRRRCGPADLPDRTILFCRQRPLIKLFWLLFCFSASVWRERRLRSGPCYKETGYSGDRRNRADHTAGACGYHRRPLIPEHVGAWVWSSAKHAPRGSENYCEAVK